MLDPETAQTATFSLWGKTLPCRHEDDAPDEFQYGKGAEK